LPAPPSAGQLISISTKPEPLKGSPVQLSTRRAVRTWGDVPRNYTRESSPKHEVRHRNYWDDEPPDMSGIESDMSEQAEAWMEHEREGSQASPIYCGNCGSAMHDSRSNGRFQMSCSYCGVKGPIDDSRWAARSLARALFSTDP
jgi:hypothetical protein